MVVRHDEDVGARRQLTEDQLGQHRHLVWVDAGVGVRERGERLIAERLSPAVNKVQVKVVTGQNAGELVAHVAHPEDRDDGRHR